jgi:mannose-1-phosphate guanylyltransferase
MGSGVSPGVGSWGCRAGARNQNLKDDQAMTTAANFYPVILAGGRGTRFWPLSRKRRAKQLLALDGAQSMAQDTVSRLQPLAPKDKFWIITNDDSRPEILRQLPELPTSQVIAEPTARNTAPAIGLAAFLLLRSDPSAVLGLFPSDHVIGQQENYREDLRRGIEVAVAGNNIVVMGIPPTRPETGYGYIEVSQGDRSPCRAVKCFREKPKKEQADAFLKAGNFFWNSGMFLWSARTLADALLEHLPKTAAVLEKIAASYGTPDFAESLRRLYPECENISIDYAVLEPRSAKPDSCIYCIPASFSWNDLGSWTALHEHHAARIQTEGKNVISGSDVFTLDANGNYIHAPGKFVAAVGVENLVIVETDDALLITTRERAQDVGKVVKYLDEKKLDKLV